MFSFYGEKEKKKELILPEMCLETVVVQIFAVFSRVGVSSFSSSAKITTRIKVRCWHILLNSHPGSGRRPPDRIQKENNPRGAERT